MTGALIIRGQMGPQFGINFPVETVPRSVVVNFVYAAPPTHEESENM